MHSAESLDGGFDNLLSILHRIVIRNRFSTGPFDLVDYYICCLCASGVRPLEPRGYESNEGADLRGVSFSLEGTTQVVYHHARASSSKEEGIRSPEAATSSSHDNDLVVEPEVTRWCSAIHDDICWRKDRRETVCRGNGGCKQAVREIVQGDNPCALRSR